MILKLGANILMGMKRIRINIKTGMNDDINLKIKKKERNGDNKH